MYKKFTKIIIAVFLIVPGAANAQSGAITDFSTIRSNSWKAALIRV
jgi:hypothetical protein